MSDDRLPGLPRPRRIPRLPRDVGLLFLTRFLRLFAFGLLSVILVLYLAELGLSPAVIGLLLTLTLVGDTLISLLLSVRADRSGRRLVLGLGAGLMVLAALLLAAGDILAVLVVAAILGVISPSGNEVGPFLSVEQSALSEFVTAEERTRAFVWYNLTGSLGTALGALCAGLVVAWARVSGLAGAAAYRPVLGLYALLGMALLACFCCMSPAVEVGNARLATGLSRHLGLHQSRPMVMRLSALFALDSFGGGLVVQSVLAYWIHARFGTGPAALGTLFLAANVLSGASYIAAGWLARRIGLINTMVFTHLPANMLLLFIPLMPDFAGVAAVLLLRSCITQMDVPTRQAYLMAVVSADERSAAAGVTSVARSLGAALSPSLAMTLMGTAALAGTPFYIAGVLKIAYDLMLYRGFIHHRPGHEAKQPVAGGG